MLYIDFEDAVEIGFDADKDIDYWEFRQTTFVGKKLPEEWRLPHHIVYEKNMSHRDFLMGYDNAPFVSQRAYECINMLIEPHVQFIKFGKIKGINYYVMNVVSLIDCLDVEHSEISYSPENPHKILAVDQFVFIDKQSIDVPIFKIPQDTGKIFVTLPFVEYVRQNRLTGIGFEDPSNISVVKPNRIFNDLPIR